jgi:hypothetical protein
MSATDKHAGKKAKGYNDYKLLSGDVEMWRLR